MFGIGKKIKELNAKIDQLLIDNKVLRVHLAIDKFKASHKPIFKEGDMIDGFKIISPPIYDYNDRYLDYTHPSPVNYFGLYVHCRYCIKRSDGGNIFGQSSYSEYELFKKKGASKDDFIKLTTKK